MTSTTSQSTTLPLTTATMIQSPPWPGKFAIAGYCLQSQCCCPTGILVVAKTSSTTLSISATLSTTTYFSTACFIYYTGPQTFSMAYPTGYNIVYSIGSISYSFTLSSDGNTIMVTASGNSACDDTATRI